MRWRRPLGAVVALLLVAGVVGAVAKHGGDDHTRLDSSGTTPTTEETTTTLVEESTTTSTVAVGPATTLVAATTTIKPKVPATVQLTGAGMWLVRVDGSAPRLASQAPMLPSHGAWSRDGKRLAFAAGTNGGGDTQLYLGDADGQGAHVFGDVSHEWYPSFSPSGKWLGMRGLAGSAPSQPGLDRLVVDAASGATTILPGGEGAAGKWHPTQDKYLYATGETSRIYDATTTQTTTIPFPSEGPVAWSPSGDRVAGCTAGKVTTAKADGTDAQIVADIGTCTAVADCAVCGGVLEWSDAGILAHGSGDQIVVIDPSAGARRNIGAAAWASWSPSERGLIALAQTDNGAPTVVLTHSDSASTRTLARAPSGTKIQYVAWAPAGDRLVVMVSPPAES